LDFDQKKLKRRKVKTDSTKMNNQEVTLRC